MLIDISHEEGTVLLDKFGLVLPEVLLGDEEDLP